MSNFIVYKTTNLINSKIYIGVHKVVTPDDTYLGSGKLIKKAIKKLINSRKNLLLNLYKQKQYKRLVCSDLIPYELMSYADKIKSSNLKYIYIILIYFIRVTYNKFTIFCI